tara:strand:+ start:39 stop:275 length:237 start_codon:yes stop_codon:yes gene_type:complete
MAGPFKMKGSPMQRNFGVSPVKDDKKKKESIFPSASEKFKNALDKIKYNQEVSTRKNILNAGEGPKKTSGFGPRVNNN